MEVIYAKTGCLSSSGVFAIFADNVDGQNSPLWVFSIVPFILLCFPKPGGNCPFFLPPGQ